MLRLVVVHYKSKCPVECLYGSSSATSSLKCKSAADCHAGTALLHVLLTACARRRSANPELKQQSCALLGCELDELQETLLAQLQEAAAEALDLKAAAGAATQPQQQRQQQQASGGGAAAGAVVGGASDGDEPAGEGFGIVVLLLQQKFPLDALI